MVEREDEFIGMQAAGPGADFAGGWQCSACGQQVADSAVACPRDGTRKLSALEQDSQFRGYAFISAIGSGGMGVIYKARQTALNKVVAIKMLHPYLVSDEAVRRFQIEGQAVSKLEHANIIKVHIMGVCDSGPYMIMDYVEGRTLTQVLQSEGPLSIERALPIFIQACDALAHAHSRAVLHRDLKPSNIMLRRNFRNEEEVCIMDFGIAKMIGDTANGDGQQLTRTGEAIGSPLYMSPEQGRGATDIDARSDVYSLGCVMFEALTGAPPFQGNTPLETLMMHMNAKPLGLSQSMLGTRKFDETIEAAVERLLQKEPDRRFQSMDELRRHLLAIKDGKQLNQLVYQPPAPKGIRVGVAAGVLVAVIALAAIVVCVSDFGKTDGRKPTPKSADQPAEPAFEANLLTARALLTKAVTEGATVIAPPLNEVVPITDTDMIVLRQARNAETIELKKSAEITARGLENLVDLPKLKHVDVSWCPQIKTLALFRRFKALKSLELCGDSNIGDKELDDLRGLPIENLDLSSTQVIKLDALPTMSHLENLSVARTPIKPEAMRNIGALKSLMSIDLSGTAITDPSLRFLFGLPHLSLINVTDCSNLSIPAVKNLQKNLTRGCIVVFPQAAENRTELSSGQDIKQMMEKVKLLADSHHYDETESVCTRALKLLQKDELKRYDDIVYFERYLALCKMFSAKPQLQEACRLIDDTIFRIEQGDVANDPRVLAQTYFLKSSILSNMGKMNEAMEAATTSENIYEKLNRESVGDQAVEMDMAAGLRTLSMWHLNPQCNAYDLPKGTHELERAYAIWRKDSPVNAGVCCHSLGDVYRAQAMALSNEEERARLLSKSLRMYEEADQFNRKAKRDQIAPAEITVVKNDIASVKAELQRLKP
jgi:serine/threonine protein kinase/tetratricopeptide (TPR) repeat protein